jgi:hypothetical protein
MDVVTSSSVLFFLKIKKKKKIKKIKKKTFINFTNTLHLTPKPTKKPHTVAAGGVNTPEGIFTK